MAVSKRLRYEILRRDNHSCKYCGQAAPEVKLTVDHVVPVALGGSDAPTNLVAACVDCNAGKSSTSPDAPLVEEVSRSAKLLSAALQQLAKDRELDRVMRSEVEDLFMQEWWEAGHATLPRDFETSIWTFMDAGLDFGDLIELAQVSADASQVKESGKWKYFCGCCWTRLRKVQEEAVALAEVWERQGVSCDAP